MQQPRDVEHVWFSAAHAAQLHVPSTLPAVQAAYGDDFTVQYVSGEAQQGVAVEQSCAAGAQPSHEQTWPVVFVQRIGVGSLVLVGSVQ